MADNNIVIKITSEAELTDAQLQLRELSDLTKQYEQQMKDLQKAEEDDLKAMKERVAAGKEDVSILQEVTATYREMRKVKQQQINDAKKSIETLSKETKAFKQMEAGSKKLTQQLREMRERMMQMEEAGEGNTKAYEQLAVAAARLQDQLGDTQTRIRVLASDTKNLDAALSLGSGVAGMFNVATSTAALFGGEMEELEKAFYKVQAVMMIVNSLQEVANVLNKDSAASIVLNTALEKIRAKVKMRSAAASSAAAAAETAETAALAAETTATEAATGATAIFNATLLANPITWIVAGIAALVAGVVALVGWFKKSKEEARGFAASMEAVNKAVKESEAATSYAARLAEAEGKSWKQVSKIEEKGLQTQMNTAARAYNEMLEKKKKANGKISDEEQQHMDDMLALYKEKHEALLNLRQDFHIKEVAEEHQRLEDLAQANKEYAQRRREEIKDAAEQLKDLQVALMGEGKDKEVAAVNLEYERKIEAIKGKSAEEIALRAALEEEKQQKLGEIALRYETERWEKEEEIRKKAEEELKAAEEEELRREQEYMEAVESAREKYGLISSQEQLANELAELQVAYQDGLLTFEEWEKAKAAINAKYIEERKQQEEEARQAELQKIQETYSMIADVVSQSADLMFEALSNSIQKQMDALDKFYTTDADEAARDANKKYLTEKQYEQKKAELTMRQQKLNKVSAAFQIGLSTAAAIMNAMATAPWPVSIVQAALAGTMGAAQLAVALSKPLPQYAKGRKGGKGEYAIVGEKGAELMYVPDGASIVPHNKMQTPSAWAAFGVPEMPNTDSVNYAALAGIALDYDKLGKAVAENMPKNEHVVVNVDRSGVSVTRGRSTRSYLNTKYAGQWN